MINKLKVGLVFDDSLDSNDGVQQYVKTLGSWLRKQGHEVRYLVGETNNSGEFQPFVHSLSRNIQIKGNQNKMFLPLASSARKIQQVLDSEKFDILHIMMPFNPLMGSRVVRRAKNTPIVGSFHMVGGTRLINSGAYALALLQRSSLKKVDTFLSVSAAAQDFESKHFKIDSQISPNMVDIKPFQKGQRKEFLRGKNGTIVFLGRLVERKGAQHLLHALRILHQQTKLEGVLVHICVDGELRAELEQYTLEHKLNDHILFHGFIDEIEKADYLASADIAIYPATGGEAFGIVLIEAMATNNPVVLGGDNAGYTTVLGGRGELLFDPLDHQALADKIEHFLINEKAAKQAVKWQSDEVKKYDVSKVGSEIVDIYRKTIADK